MGQDLFISILTLFHFLNYHWYFSGSAIYLGSEVIFGFAFFAEELLLLHDPMDLKLYSGGIRASSRLPKRYRKGIFSPHYSIKFIVENSVNKTKVTWLPPIKGCQVTFTSSECTTQLIWSGNTLLQHLQNLIPIQYNTLDSFSRQDLLRKSTLALLKLFDLLLDRVLRDQVIEMCIRDRILVWLSGITLTVIFLIFGCSPQ